MNKLLLDVKKHVHGDEQILSFVIGIFERDKFLFSYHQGIFVATNKRLLFYEKLPYFPAKFEEYSYFNIENIDMYPQLVFTHRNETVKARYIQAGNIVKFVHIVQDCLTQHELKF